jgi:hypothetical protein
MVMMILFGRAEAGWLPQPSGVLAGLHDCAKSVYFVFVFMFMGVDFGVLRACCLK